MKNGTSSCGLEASLAISLSRQTNSAVNFIVDDSLHRATPVREAMWEQ